ncbi:LSU ribosomal protein L23P [Desulfatibacillum alkenivorans DSM 16219]|jgi:large subunit ribosomal protein L23|uniref:Large ribosomal subunit protein uL23 n=1 Tax=Desulfatibacillum alkenivorans DSM 16219 TaxID=1121393 RepID=A0A1M6WCW0_9BACT|nr:50S ribosomal protein L23 [Desulfatibacillum alkenivorans]SHK91416.1 LSU ribosomal protein L23P [Desulfatibacillum alkenivorans DSM 16219]
MNAYEIIRRPVVTEKSTIQKEENNQLTFEVDKKANKVEIARAIEKIFKVKVLDVRTSTVNGKFKRRGRVLGKRRDWKKAMVTLAPGARIDFFDGV